MSTDKIRVRDYFCQSIVIHLMGQDGINEGLTRKAFDTAVLHSVRDYTYTGYMCDEWNDFRANMNYIWDLTEEEYAYMPDDLVVETGFAFNREIKNDLIIFSAQGMFRDEIVDCFKVLPVNGNDCRAGINQYVFGGYDVNWLLGKAGFGIERVRQFLLDEFHTELNSTQDRFVWVPDEAELDHKNHPKTGDYYWWLISIEEPDAI